jgi:short-subunit dehydrogenase
LTSAHPIHDWRGQWAVVTGASAGIGWALAEELAAGGANLLLTARRRERLEQLAEKLRAAHRVNVETVAADLSQPGGPADVFAFTEKKNLQIDLLVNNAGFGTYGEFSTNDLAAELGIVKVNCAAVVHLTHLYLSGMVERGQGDILIVSSTAAFQGVPYMATYGASKAFDLLFAEALAQEVERYGVRVCALCPGPTESEFGEVAGSPQRAPTMREKARKVARVGLRALAAGKHSVISGYKNWLGAEIQRALPRRLVTRGTAMVFRPKHLR